MNLSNESDKVADNNSEKEIVYNVTTNIHSDINEDWLEWLKKEHLADILNTGCFTKAIILKMLDIDAEDPTYTIQYFAKNRKLYQLYIDKYAPVMRQKSIEKWGDKFIAFRSVMEVVN